MRSRAQLQWCVLVVVAAFTGAGALPAGAIDINGFQPPAGQGDVVPSYSFESYDEFWVGDRKVSDPGVGETEIRSLSLWAQYGLTDRLALLVNLPYIDADSDGLGDFSESGLQDLTVLAKYRFASLAGPAARHSFTAAAGGRTPASDYEDNLPVDIGDGTSDFLFRFVYQLEAGRFYFSQQVGYDLRGDDAPDGIPIYTELGFTTGSLTWIGFYSQLPADGGTDIGDPGFTFPSNKDEYSRAGAKLYAQVGGRWGFSVLGFTTLDGRNSGETQGFSVGTNVRF